MYTSYGLYPNIKFSVDDKIYNVDRNILVGSEFFTTMFNGNFMENSMDIIVISDIDKEEWETLLKFVLYIIYHIFLLLLKTSIMILLMLKIIYIVIYMI